MADLDFSDRDDFDDVERGFVGTLDDPVVTAADGHVVWLAARHGLCDVFTDLDRTYRTELSNGALIHADAGYGSADPGLTVTLTTPQLLGVIATGDLGAVTREGDATLVADLLALVDRVDHQFPIVTP